MGISNLYIEESHGVSNAHQKIYLLESDDGGSRTVTVTWRTASTQTASWTAKCTVSGTARGSDEAYVVDGSTTKTYSATWTSAKCNETTDSGNHDWSHELDMGDLVDDWAGGTWEYGDRVCDMLTLNFSISITNDSGTYTASNTFYAYWMPVYELTGAKYTSSENLRISYDTTWEQSSIYVYISGGDYGVFLDGENACEMYRSTQSHNGYVNISSDHLTRHLAGKEVDIYFKLFQTWDHAAPNDADVLLDGTVTVGGDDGSTPELELASADWNGVTVQWEADDDAESITLKLVGGKYTFDEITIEPDGDSGTATFAFPPLGVDFEIEAVVDFGDGDTSSTAVLSVPAIDATGIAVGSVDGDAQLLLETRPSGSDLWSVEVEPEVETVQLSGRRRPCAYYGSGGSTSVDFEGAVMDDAADWEALPDEGDFVCRFPDGRRYAVTGTVEATRTSSGVIELSIEGDEVDA